MKNNLKNQPIYVYTDGGSLTKPDGTRIAAAAFRRYNGWTTFTSCTLLDGATNNKAELEAINMALKEIATEDGALTSKTIQIFTDSEISMKAIYRGAKELKKYYMKSDDTVESLDEEDITETLNEIELKTSEGKRLMNQEIVKEILVRIFDISRVEKSQIPLLKNVKFIHIFGHMNPNNPGDVAKQQKKLKSQGYDYDTEMVIKIIKSNSIVDNLCSDVIAGTVRGDYGEHTPSLEEISKFFNEHPMMQMESVGMF
jgi:ribonuclease HI